MWRYLPRDNLELHDYLRQGSSLLLSGACAAQLGSHLFVQSDSCRGETVNSIRVIKPSSALLPHYPLNARKPGKVC